MGDRVRLKADCFGTQLKGWPIAASFMLREFYGGQFVIWSVAKKSERVLYYERG